MNTDGVRRLKADRIQAPVLLIHGENDENVSIEHARMIEDKLKEAGKPVETWYYSGFTHFPPQENRRIVRRLAEWMKHGKMPDL